MNISKYILSIFLLINSISATFSQNNADAERLTNNLINSFQKQAVQTDFTIKVSEKNSVNSQMITGKIVLRANQFFLESEELKVWFDGKTQWAYIKEANEVNISEPDAMELAQINPVAIISGFKAVSNIHFSKTKSSTNNIIVFTSKSKKADFNTITIQISKTTEDLQSINIEYKNGITNNISFKNYQKNLNIKPDIFKFDKSKANGALVNDLR
ncbi:LolA-like putative outer membrane lipoprotein chaperone [Paludibacter sp.]